MEPLKERGAAEVREEIETMTDSVTANFELILVTYNPDSTRRAL